MNSKGIQSNNNASKAGAGPRVNEQIRVPEVRLIGDDGTQYGVVRIEEAKRIAQEKNLDLVEVSPMAKPPVVKVIDYGKFKYQIQKRANEAKKKQVVVQVKELQFRPNIEKHDVETKVKKVEEFLENGDRVKMTMQFRGRELSYKSLGMEKFKTILDACVALGAILESPPEFMGNRLIAMLAPVKKK